MNRRCYFLVTLLVVAGILMGQPGPLPHQLSAEGVAARPAQAAGPDPAASPALPASVGNSPNEDATTYRVRLASSGILPDLLIVPAGAQVAWTNGTSQTLVLRSGELSLVFLPVLLSGTSGALSADLAGAPAVQPAQPAQRTGLFDVTLAPGQTFTYTFSTVGTFPYYVGTRAQFKGRVLVTQAGPPPDPGSVATTIDPSQVTDIADSTAFLYSGANPIQVGVAPGTIEAKRVGVLRGRVLGQDGTPISGVQVAVLDHPEFGQTLTRLDGRFDLAANGGGLLTLTYQKPGYLPLQRQQNVPWRDFVELPDVVMLAADAQVGGVDLSSSTMQVVLANPVSDADGSRQAALLIPPGTQATLVFPGGDTQALTSFHARITEYTVGNQGQQAMPAALPPQSGYTYADEYTVDEAVAAGASGVSFSQPLLHYSQNFLNFPVGSVVPAGYYDRDAGLWVPSQNGRVVQITGIAGGLAELDTDGDGIADNGAVVTPTLVLSITTGERQQLAGLYTAGASLWRVPVSHFSAWDCNWPYTPLTGAQQPKNQRPQNDHQDKSCHWKASDIDCQNQILGETADIVGTPFALTYESDRVPGRKSAYSLDIPLTGPDVPTSTQRVDLDVRVAGQELTQTFPALPDQMYRFTWDGQDVYGRVPQGDQLATIRVGYVYTATYQEPAQFDQAFAAFSGVPLSSNRARQEATLWQEFQAPIGAWDARGLGLGGWSLNVQHVYDPNSRVLHLGDGGQRSVESTGQVITTAVGTGDTGNDGDGGPAGLASLYDPEDVAVAPDGSLYIASYDRIRRVAPNGIISTVAGGGSPDDHLGDGGPAIQAEFYAHGIALGRDGSLYISDGVHNSVRWVSPAGIITTIAGTGTDGFGGDGGPAARAQLSDPKELAVGPDGSLYIAEGTRVRRVSPDGIITTVAGGDYAQDELGDGGPATQAGLGNGPLDVKVGPDGSLYIAQLLENRVRRVGLNGIITTVAGGGDPPDGLGDGGPATEAALGGLPSGLAVARDGTLYISEVMADLSRIRRVGPDGTISTLAGTGDPGFSGDGGQPARAQLDGAQGLALGPDGSLYIADGGNDRIRRIGPDLPGFTAGESLIPSEDGREVYVFSSAGRHLRTLDALTAAIRYQFTYDSAGHLIQVTDGYSNTTRIERDASGAPTAIVAPFGQRTTLSLNADGYLSSIANPAGETQQFAYNPGGLLASLSDARSNVHHFSYDTQGRLASDADPAGGFKTLARAEAGRAYTVTLTTALSRTTTYQTEFLPQGGQRDKNTFPDGTTSQFLVGADGSVAGRYSDGTRLALTPGPDPRWGMRAPIDAAYVISTPAGLAMSMTMTSTAQLANGSDPFSLVALTDTVLLNNRQYASVYAGGSRTLTETMPSGRLAWTLLDAHGRLAQEQAANLAPTRYAYDDKGRLTTLTDGTGAEARVVNLGYNSAGFLDTLTDPLGRVVTWGYDAAGRVLTQTLADGRVIYFAYDANGNITSITPPGRPAHTFAYSSVDLATEYSPPNVGAGNYKILYTYNADQQLTRVTRPDGQTLNLSYDSAGRLSTLTLPRGQVSYGYHATSGNLVTVTAPGGITLTYDHDGALMTGETWAGAIYGSVTRTYDNNMRVTSRSVNGSNPIALQYDADGLLTGAGDLTLSRDAQNGLITGATLGNVSDARSYNSLGEMTGYSASFSGSALFARQYTRDKLGRITQVTETIAGATTLYGYSYDLAGRLTAVTGNGATVAQYTYDSNGNRLSFTGPGGTVNGSYDNQDRLTQYGTTTYAYTSNGELASKTVGGQTTTYEYDPLGNLMRVALPSGTQVEYLVDGQNRRIGKKVNGTVTQGWLYQDHLKPIAELDGTGNIVSRFVYATYTNVPEYMIKGGVTYRVVADHLGSPRLVVNAATGAIAQRMDYDAFGNVTQDTNPGFQPFGFAGGLYDRDTRLVRFGARDYDPETGRWTAKDPIRFHGGDVNLYGYVLNDSVNLADRRGLFIRYVDPSLQIFVDRLERTSTGRLLLDTVNASPIPVDIERGSVGYDDKGKLIAGLTTFDPCDNSIYITIDQASMNLYGIPVMPVIGHELAHARQAIEGWQDLPREVREWDAESYETQISNELP